ncbi:hypothetical protein [Candidatus Magnetobacterium casense]|uniref:Uncharacterized protein n=1 Tax=Candidatus Magnetobacterium casense TaxID=1455061 RepID=A0ABS6S4C0_9BACT|nr:hypothetical protein [Candidatus Magnetobacterium casensis]MBV6343699.1 hypothetical protein [Candidatus Magnetobacterium casensis]
MTRIREGDESTNLQSQLKYGLNAKEKQRIKPGPMDWAKLMMKVKAIGKISELNLTGTLLTIPGVSKEWSTATLVTLAESINEDIRNWVNGYEEKNDPRVAILGFAYHWKLLRTFVPLQLRLAVEQVLYEKGGSWQRLITGFRPL